MNIADSRSRPVAATGPCPRAAGQRTDPRHAVGRRGETLAAEHLCRLGFSTVGQNERTRYGEIDLISFDGHTLVFCEVKTRRLRTATARPRADQRPLSSLGHRQRARIRGLAVAWLSDETRRRPTARRIRFDAIGVTIDADGGLLSIDHVEGAW